MVVVRSFTPSHHHLSHHQRRVWIHDNRNPVTQEREQVEAENLKVAENRKLSATNRPLTRNSRTSPEGLTVTHVASRPFQSRELFKVSGAAFASTSFFLFYIFFFIRQVIDFYVLAVAGLGCVFLLPVLVLSCWGLSLWSFRPMILSILSVFP